MKARVALGFAAAYFVAVIVVSGPPASAAAVAHGRVWLLLTSALDVQGPLPLAQVAIAAAVAGLAIMRLGAWAWWRAALAGHVGSALAAYAAIGLAVLLGSASAERAASRPDYGISCVLAASLGALLVTRDRVAIAVGAAGTVALVPLSLGWYGSEHLVAVAIGAAVSARTRPRSRGARP